MKLIKTIMNKFAGWLGKKKQIERKTVIVENTNNTITQENLEIKKLNSRVSFLTQKMEEMQTQQNQLLVLVEQILFHTSGSFDEDQNQDVTFDKEGKNLVQIKSNYKLN
jgi:uncharacterized coiled-coil protein SlyX